MGLPDKRRVVGRGRRGKREWEKVGTGDSKKKKGQERSLGRVLAVTVCGHALWSEESVGAKGKGGHKSRQGGGRRDGAAWPSPVFCAGVLGIFCVSFLFFLKLLLVR